MPRAVGNRKVCKDCGEEKDLEDFHKHSQTKDGRNSYCKSCHHARAMRNQHANPERHREYAKRSYHRRIEKIRQYYIDNKDLMNENGKLYHQSHKLIIESRHRNNSVAKRKLFLKKYGGKCSCCGENIEEFLTIEHINGQKGKKKENSYTAYKNSLNDEYAGVYTILCMNCNFSKGKYGYCPHQKTQT